MIFMAISFGSAQVFDARDEKSGDKSPHSKP
jgi:hypothetical protein